MRIIIVTIMMLCLVALGKLAYGQNTITGISCVTPVVEYEYSFNAGLDSSALVQVCVTGGIIAGNSTNCKTGGGLSSIKVIWNGNIETGTIKVSYPDGKSVSKNINITAELAAGEIDTAILTQYVSIKKLPADIESSPAKGGNCNPSYSYQWQQSTTTLDWKDISGALNKNLKFSSPLTELRYFRKKVIETNSGSIAYSNVAAVFVNK